MVQFYNSLKARFFEAIGQRYRLCAILAPRGFIEPRSYFLLDSEINAKSLVKSIFFALVYLGVYVQTPVAAAADSSGLIKLYVSTKGDDSADGNFNAPFATLERARDELRKLSANTSGLSEGAAVIVRGGAYELQNTFQLDSQDSGTSRAPIVYRPYKGEKVVLSGGRTLDNCRSTNSGLTSCDTRKLRLQKLDDLGLDDRIRGSLPPFEVFVDGDRLQLARWPNADLSAPGGNTWAHVTSAPKNSFHQFSYKGKPKLNVRLTKDAVIHIWPGNDWFDQYVGIKTTSGSNFTLADRVAYPIEAGRRFSILNVEEALDAPGEWYYSTASEELKVFPLPGSERERPVVSYLNTVIAMRGTQNVRMEGFVIEHSRKTGVTVNGGQGNTFTGFTVRNTGGFGIHVNGGREHSVVDSEIHDTGYGGLILKGGDRKILTASDHNAIGNNIHHTGRLIRVAKAALHLEGVGNNGRQNHIHHTPGMAVLIKGNDHLLEYNNIHHACEESADCGAVYTGRNWTFHGNLIRYNSIHDIYGYGMKSINASTSAAEYATPHEARGVYLDDAASGINVVGNLFYRIPDRMIQIGGGRNNLVDNNIFITNSYAIWMDARWQDFPWEKFMTKRLNAVPYKSAVWRTRFPRLAEPMKNPRWPEGNKITHNIFIGEHSTPGMFVTFRYKIPPENLEIDNNIVWNQGSAVKVDYRLLKDGTGGVRDWAKWRKATGHDKNSLLADPHFFDAANGDFRLRQYSPARALGIKEIPLKTLPPWERSPGYNDIQKVRESSPPAAASGVKVY